VLSHVVLLKPRDDMPAAERQALLAAFEGAVSEIPSVRRVQMGRRIRHGASYESAAPDVADYFVMIFFDDQAGLEAYFRHPAHARLAGMLQEWHGSAAVYDFEVGGAELLRER
jgi:hypothetical protein